MAVELVPCAASLTEYRPEFRDSLMFCRLLSAALSSLPAVIFAGMHFFNVDEEAYYTRPWQISAVVFCVTSFLLGLNIPVRKAPDEIVSPAAIRKRFLAHTALAWALAVAVLFGLSFTPMVLGQDNGDGTNTYTECWVFAIFSTFVCSGVVVPSLLLSSFVLAPLLQGKRAKAPRIGPTTNGLSATAILIVVAVWYMLKAVGLKMISGVSMASVEGVASDTETDRAILSAISPGIVYLVGAVVLNLQTILDKNTARVQRAIRTTFYAHLGWFGLRVIYHMIAPLEPVLLAHHASPAAQAIHCLGMALPYVLFGVMLVACFWRGAPSIEPQKASRH